MMQVGEKEEEEEEEEDVMMHGRSLFQLLKNSLLRGGMEWGVGSRNQNYKEQKI